MEGFYALCLICDTEYTPLTWLGFIDNDNKYKILFRHAVEMCKCRGGNLYAIPSVV